MFSIILIYKTMVQLMLKPIIRDRLVLLMILFPSSIIFSSILLREAIIAFLVTLSLYIFMKWVQTGAYRMVFLSTAVCLLGALFHSRSEEHTSELQSRFELVCRLLPE